MPTFWLQWLKIHRDEKLSGGSARRAIVILGTLKTRDWKIRDQMTGVENAGLENAGPTKYGKPNVT